MKREILFRVKVNNPYTSNHGMWLYLEPLKNASFDNTDLATVCQFTGLKDRTGTRIFEHDIIYAEVGDGDYPAYYEGRVRQGMIVWCDEECAFKLDDEKEGCVPLDEIDSICVIGNKFDGIQNDGRYGDFDDYEYYDEDNADYSAS